MADTIISGNVEELEASASPFLYLAAPFFNNEQVELVKKVEEHFQEFALGINVFSPRLQHGNTVGPIRNREHAKQVFDKNFDAICGAQSMLAIIDWLMPPNKEIRTIHADTIKPGIVEDKVAAISGPALNLPDTGTVWEMGAAYVQKLHLACFTLRPESAGVNLMLTCGCDGIVYGFDALENFLKAAKFEPKIEEYIQAWESLPAWKGAWR